MEGLGFCRFGRGDVGGDVADIGDLVWLQLEGIAREEGETRLWRREVAF